MNLIEPLVQRVARAATRVGIGPNALTTTGFAVACSAALAYAGGAARWGGALLLVAAGCDLLSGRVARHADPAASTGALYRSVTDRLGEVVICAGAGWWLWQALPPARAPVSAGLVLAALAGLQLAAYVPARAAALGLEARAGVPLAAARVLALGAPSLVVGAGPAGARLFWMMALLAVVAWATAALRVAAAVRAAGGGVQDVSSRRRVTLPGRTVPNRHLPRGEAPR